MMATNGKGRAPGAENAPGPLPASAGGDRTATRAAGERRAVGYVRLSPGERKDAAAGNGRAVVGVGAADQRASIERRCERDGLQLVELVEDIDKTGKTLNRPGLTKALKMLDGGRAEVLVAAKLDRLARSVIAFGGLLEQAESGGWAIVVLDFDLDTSTASGRLVANLMMAVAQWEREAIGERTKAALAVKRAQGVRLGRPPAVPDLVRERIRQERKAGASFRAIADGLTAEGVPTAHGGTRWYASTVRSVLG